jgi:hypothetical protein
MDPYVRASLAALAGYALLFAVLVLALW